jgi:hypothetical protein
VPDRRLGIENGELVCDFKRATAVATAPRWISGAMRMRRSALPAARLTRSGADFDLGADGRHLPDLAHFAVGHGDAASRPVAPSGLKPSPMALGWPWMKMSPPGL